MIKRISIFIISLSYFFAFAQNGTQINKTDNNGKKQGVWKKYEQGKLVYEGQFKDNIPYGTFKYYHKNGKLKSETNFIQGVHKVKTIIYYENGHKASEGNFIDQQKDGEWRYFNQNDSLLKIENYKNGSKNGLWKTYSSENGKLLEECEYLDGQRNGIHRTYYTNGNISLEENFVKGKTNGKSTAYYPNGNISLTGNYHLGWREGEWHQYDIKGKIRTTSEYMNQRLKHTYIYMYMKGVGQKLNQDLVAYFVTNGNKTSVILKNGNKIQIDETLEDVESWLDFTLFIRVNPRYIAAIDAVISYKNIEGSDDAITIKMLPQPDEEIYSEGVTAKLVKSLFNTEKPKQ